MLSMLPFYFDVLLCGLMLYVLMNVIAVDI